MRLRRPLSILLGILGAGLLQPPSRRPRPVQKRGRRRWRTPAALYALISHPLPRALLGWDLVRRDVRWVPVAPGTRCVEVGSGGAFYTARLARHLGRGGLLVALDPEPAGVPKAVRRRLRGRPAARVAPLGGDGQRLPLADESVDVLFYGYSLEEMPDPPGALGEAHRVLRPGGHLVLFLWRPVMRGRRRIATEAIAAALFEAQSVRRGPQNIRARYRKPARPAVPAQSPEAEKAGTAWATPF
ncbi:class I SAM-dependent methyltransferase [Streptomyces sp. RB6PN25]|uniref:Class I SAM-dependent methyltransferase n=1 Tax=Streptomyces humicola TaxID=2953240 RepID=A0ABT1Q0Z5_9ACTN|nr:class I SAM-dependent methyltransferase [Streptomyces humicola]MCQ4083584.1 class I SAM-dependent methyltransferase [Streptomyces humicola]